MKVHLPNSAFLGNIDPFLKSIDISEPGTLVVSTHPTWVSVHPMVLSMLAALAVKVGKENATFENVTARSGHYLQRMGLFNFFGTCPKFDINEHDPSGRFIPIAQIKTQEESTTFITEMIPMLHLPHTWQADAIRHIVSELVRNVLEHAETTDGAFACAQYFSSSNTIRIGIADTGIGIRRSLSRSHQTSDHLEAIKLSLFPGITGTTRREGGTAQNAGAGLFVIKSIAYVNRDLFLAYSGDAMFKLLRRGRKEEETVVLHANPNLDNHSTTDNLPTWQGTVVGIDISLDSTEEFNAILEMVRSTYGKAIRERKEERYKHAARFIN